VSTAQQPATYQFAGSFSLDIWQEYSSHISYSKAAQDSGCFAADLGSTEIHVEAQPYRNVMAGAGVRAGPAPDVRYQPPATTVDIYYNYRIDDHDAAGTMVKTALLSAQGCKFKLGHKQLLLLYSMYIET
jgi:hypothetical protein